MPVVGVLPVEVLLVMGQHHRTLRNSPKHIVLDGQMSARANRDGCARANASPSAI
jgi:hypothetical protein